MLASSVGLGRCNGAAHSWFTGDMGGEEWLVKLNP